MNDKCLGLLKSDVTLQVPGFPMKETASAICRAVPYIGGKDTPFDEAVSMSRTTRWPDVAKAVSGGMIHVISVDNARSYAELWHKGGSWYAVTGADLNDPKVTKSSNSWAVYQVPRVYKGMPLDEAATRFLTTVFGSLTTKAGGCGCK